MNCIKIVKEDGSAYPLYFTDSELYQIHQFVEYRNLEEDFLNKLHDTCYQEDYWLRTKHLEAIPELMPWLIQLFRHYSSADLTHNKTLDTVLIHFHNIAFTPTLFRELETHCLTEIPGNPRKKKLDAAARALSLHEQSNCTCSGGPKNWCAAQRYLCGDLDIQDFIEMSALSEKGGQAATD